MSAVLGIILIIVVGPYLVSRIAHARNASWAGPQTAGMRGRAMRAPAPRRGSARKAARSTGSAVLHPRSTRIRAQAKADAFTAWQQAGATDWLEQRRHERADGTAPPPAGGRTAAGASPTLRGRVLGSFARTPAGKPGGGGRGESTGGTPAAPRPASWTTPRTPGAAAGGPPARQPPPPPPPSPANPASSNGGTPVAAGTSTASAEKAIEGVNEIYAHGMSGGIHAKQEALKAIHELAVRASAMVVTFARQMSEPGSNYGAEITEPLATAGTHFQAGASAVSESDAAISTLINMTVGDLAASARQAPHHSELSESGSR